MRFLLELATGVATGVATLALTAAVALMAVAVFLGWKALLGDLRRRRQDRYDDRLLARAWDDPTLLQGRIPKGRR